MSQKYNELWGRICGVFKNDGDLARRLAGFEVRSGQLEMAETVFQALSEECIAMVEAGTGVGKTFAYLIPSLYFSQALKEPVVVSTKTINLQEQLINKDIPFLQDALGEQFRAVMVKGWGNYLCRRRLSKIKQANYHFSPEEYLCFKDILSWSLTTIDGDRSEIRFTMAESVWDMVKAEFTACPNKKCPWYNNCFFFRQRKKMKDANILVTNHAMLFTHISSLRRSREQSKQTGILPPFSRLILDEAHHIEEAASDFLGDTASSRDFFRMLDVLARPGGTQKELGLLARIREQQFDPSLQTRIRNILDTSCIPRTFALREKASGFFYSTAHYEGFSTESDRIRIDKKFTDKAQALHEELRSLTEELSEYKKNLAMLGEEVERGDEDLSFEIASVVSHLEQFRDSLIKIWETSDEGWIYSLDYSRKTNPVNVEFKSYPLSVAELLHSELFSPMKTCILTSATLSINRNFKYLEKRLGLDKFEKDFLLSRIVESPFDFQRQAVLGVPGDLPFAKSENFLGMAVPHLVRMIKVMEGRTFILFTSYKMLQECGRMLEEKLKGAGFNIFIQGTRSRSHLLEKFRKCDNAVLLGTDSFWEGVDVPGRDLECVIIMKLPFMVPTDPIIKAISEHMESQGLNPFTNFQIPKAIIKFKQGFGRLIRNSRDRGVIIIMDRRIVEKFYGRLFLNSLPRCRILKGSFAGIIDYVEKWLKTADSPLICSDEIADWNKTMKNIKLGRIEMIESLKTGIDDEFFRDVQKWNPVDPVQELTKNILINSLNMIISNFGSEGAEGFAQIFHNMEGETKKAGRADQEKHPYEIRKKLKEEILQKLNS